MFLPNSRNSPFMWDANIMLFLFLFLLPIVLVNLLVSGGQSGIPLVKPLQTVTQGILKEGSLWMHIVGSMWVKCQVVELT